MGARTGGVLIFGLDQCGRNRSHTGFFRSLALALHREGVPVAVAYLTELSNRPLPIDEYGAIEIRPLRVTVPSFSKRLIKGFQSSQGMSPHFYSPGPRAQLARSVALLQGLPALVRLVRKYRPQAISLSDNLGVLSFLVKAAAPKAAVTGFLHMFRGGSRRYRRYTRACYGPLNRIVATNHRLADELVSSGVSRQKVVVIPWGVEIGPAPAPEVGSQHGHPIVMWSGPLQSMSLTDIDAAATIAQSLAAKHLALRTIFAFKPNWLVDHQLPPLPPTIEVLSETESFLEACERVSILLSPIGLDPREDIVVVGPPLTWIEFMEREGIVAALNTPGAEELIDDGQDGLRCASVDQLIERVDALLQDDASLQDMRRRARQKVISKFNIKQIAECYREMWGL